MSERCTYERNQFVQFIHVRLTLFFSFEYDSFFFLTAAVVFSSLFSLYISALVSPEERTGEVKQCTVSQTEALPALRGVKVKTLPTLTRKNK